jgi:hypothetical protein
MTIAIQNIMESMQLDKEICKIDGDNETIVGTGVDMLGYQGVCFVATASKGEVAALTMKAQQDTASNFGTAADLKDTSVSLATAVNTDGFAILDIYLPLERYVRAEVVVPNVTTPVAVSVIAIRYGRDHTPETNSEGETHVSPVEGTA